MKTMQFTKNEMKQEKKVSESIESAVSELLSSNDLSKIFGKDGLFQELKKQLVNKILEKEMESYIGYKRFRRNKHLSAKHLLFLFF